MSNSLSLTAAVRRLRHELKVSVLCGWPYVYRRFVSPYPPLDERVSTPVLKPAVDDGTEVHIVTSTRDHVLAIWAAATFYSATRRHDPLVIHEYDHLSRRAAAHILRYFPDARIIFRAEADSVVSRRLACFSRLLSVRAQVPMIVKLTDTVLFGSARRIILLDSDILFFRNPRELTGPNSRPFCFSHDISSAYIIQEEPSAAAGFPLAPRICAGLGNVDPAAVDFEHAERFLASGIVKLDAVLLPHIEQTLWALQCGRGGFEHLPDTYAIRLSGDSREAVAQHYVGPVRHFFFTEGMPRAARAWRN